MKLLFHIILIIFFSYISTQTKRMNGCGIIGYDEPTKAEDCKDSNEICCYIELTKESETVKFCFPAPDKMDQSDVDEEVNQYTGYTVKSLTCFDFSQNLKYAIGNLILIGLILF